MLLLFVIPLLLTALLYIRFYRAHWQTGLSASLRFSAPRVYAGDTFSLTEIVENRKRMPVPVLELGFHISRGVSFLEAENIVESDHIYKWDIFSLRGMESIRRSYHMKARQRGRCAVSPIRFRAPSFLYFRDYLPPTDTTEAEIPFYIYAARVPVDDVLRAVETILGTVESSRRVYEDPFAFAGIREYTRQDPMKTINWKASARTGQLMVNTYTSVKAREIAVFLDAEDSFIVRHRELTEEAISVAASLLRACSGQGLRVDFFCNAAQHEDTGFTRYLIRESGTGLTDAEVYLTGDLSEEISCPFGELLVRALPETDADVCVLISANAVSDWGSGRTGFTFPSGEKSRCLWVIPYGESASRPPRRLCDVPVSARQVLG